VNHKNAMCPYCQTPHSTMDVLCISGFVNINGLVLDILCKQCNEIFRCEVDVTIAYKTRKL